MNRFYLFIVEDGCWIFTGDRKGYPTKEDAIKAAKKKVDDALPRNTIQVMENLGYAYLAGDGGEEYKDHK